MALPLGARMVLLHVALVAVAIAGSSMAAYGVLRSEYEAGTRRVLNAEAGWMATAIQDAIRNESGLVEHVAHAEVFLADHPEHDPTRAVRHLAEHASVDSRVVLADSAGNVLISLGTDPPGTDTSSPVDQPLLRAAAARPDTVVEAVRRSPADGKVAGLTLAMRFQDASGQALGHLQTTVPVSRLEKALQGIRLGKDQFAVVVDQDGLLVMSVEIPAEAATARQRPVVTTGPGTSGIRSVAGVEALVGTRHIPDTGWTVVSAYPTASAAAHLADLRRSIVLVSALLLGLSAALSWRLSQTLVRPIRLVTEVTSHIARDGDLGRRVEWVSSDEPGILASTFNWMIGRLQAASTGLEESHRRIEGILAAIADPIIVLAGDGTIVDANEAAVRLLQEQETDVRGRSLAEFLDDPRQLTLVTEQLQGEPTSFHGVEITLLRDDGAPVAVDISGSCLATPDASGARGGLVAKDITARKRTEQELQYLADHDPLTGLANRKRFMELVSEAISGSKDERVAVLFLDLDRFKAVNDSLGHETGDVLLALVASRLTGCVREHDAVARLGGDEFVVVARDLADRDQARALAERIRRVFDEPFVVADFEIVTTASVGVAVWPLDGDDPSALLKKADAAMYHAKARGKDSVQTFSSAMRVNSTDQMELEQALRRAVEQDDLQVWYQPQVSLHTGRIVGAEALVRWIHPERGTVSPGRFLPLAEETGLIVPIGESVLRTACRQGRLWKDRFGLELKMAVNFAGRQFQRTDVAHLVARTLAETGFPAHLFVAELTEGIYAAEIEQGAGFLSGIQKLGARVSVDDFGTGYSSLARLREFPIDSFKIDRAFIMGIPGSSEAIALTSAMLEIGRALGLEVIAEGVEEREQVGVLAALGCDAFQGFYFSRPVPADQFERLLETGRSLDRSLLSPLSVLAEAS